MAAAAPGESSTSLLAPSALGSSLSSSSMPQASSNPRPLLLPHNRRLRHLQGVYLRNLTFVPAVGSAIAAGGASATTVDDSALNVLSPTKLEALREDLDSPQSLQRAASSEDLVRSGLGGAGSKAAAPKAGPPGAAATASVAAAARRRRGSTNLGSANPITRQRRLEFAVDTRVADAFFSLHCEDTDGGGGEDRLEDEPVYISEVVEKAMNFNFRLFDLTTQPPSISRSSQFTLKFWTRRATASGGVWSLLVSERVDLRRLQFLGAVTNRAYPPNCLLLHLMDGIYALDLLAILGGGKRVSRLQRAPEPKHVPQLPTSSYNALMRLATLDSSIRDALAVRDGLEESINGILARQKLEEEQRELLRRGREGGRKLPRRRLSKSPPPNRSAPQISTASPAAVTTTELHSSLREAQTSLSRATALLASQQRSVAHTRRRIDELRASLSARREAISRGRELQREAATDVGHAALELLPASREAVRAVAEGLRGQRRRIAEDLGKVFRVQPVSSGVLGPVHAALVAGDRQRSRSRGLDGTGGGSGSGGNPLAFEICGLPLPNTDYNPPAFLPTALLSSTPLPPPWYYTEDALSAALGYTSLLVTLLQFYLSTPLPYTISPFHGSRSSVHDDISLLPTTSSSPQRSQDMQREFPLYCLRGSLNPGGGSSASGTYSGGMQNVGGTGGTGQYRLDYGWFLLNKDVEALCASRGLVRVPDIRHTLPNLRYLLYVCGAGFADTEEVPERKRGSVVRGLLWGAAAGRARGRRPVTDGYGSIAGSLGTMMTAAETASSGSSRRGSAESVDVTGAMSTQARIREEQDRLKSHHAAMARRENGSGRQPTTALAPTSPPTSTLLEPIMALPFDEGETKLTLRTKGLRERI